MMKADRKILVAFLLNLFFVEDLRNFHPGKIFGKKRIDIRRTILHFTVGFSGKLTEDNRKKYDKWNETKNH